MIVWYTAYSLLMGLIAGDLVRERRYRTFCVVVPSMTVLCWVLSRPG